MPLYDFHCSACQLVFERLVRMGERPVCPACSAAVEKCISKPAPPPQSPGLVKAARTQARREGHFSNY